MGLIQSAGWSAIVVVGFGIISLIGLAVTFLVDRADLMPRRAARVGYFICALAGGLCLLVGVLGWAHSRQMVEQALASAPPSMRGELHARGLAEARIAIYLGGGFGLFLGLPAAILFFKRRPKAV
ncbi:MAG: hypothetical protein H6707_18120 [Deltaproteobacteria bacterium]|nr:hypothetical protein [Deltaproteobacteria bacterium]